MKKNNVEVKKDTKPFKKEKATFDTPTNKGTLIITGSTLIGLGSAMFVDTERMWAGIAIVALGIGCLIVRELLKIK